jgi:hypothetical protein
MTNQEDEFEDEAHHWTPESDRDPEKRAHDLLDKAEKQLADLASVRLSDRRQSEAFIVSPTQSVSQAQIEIRKISNGFVILYQKAIPYRVHGSNSGIYCPSPVEAFFTTAAEAMKPLEDAIRSANLLSDSLAKIEAQQESLAKAFPEGPNHPS